MLQYRFTIYDLRFAQRAPDLRLAERGRRSAVGGRRSAKIIAPDGTASKYLALARARAWARGSGEGQRVDAEINPFAFLL